jgi:hypothetical protein
MIQITLQTSLVCFVAEVGDKTDEQWKLEKIEVVMQLGWVGQLTI